MRSKTGMPTLTASAILARIIRLQKKRKNKETGGGVISGWKSRNKTISICK
jgi:hypothetical protein